ncbi:MAG TPA: AcvB/VirJ family lysyl-phosphatidylglycerol hydrolase [Thermoanaerobaculia bacterium]|jgi:type IV secretory pathway VirJ component|nr:AcvB/VirJ family lysyl-phosphatidylglycerol hydrolase [Thermoanaerobaculia bacterium]
MKPILLASLLVLSLVPLVSPAAAVEETLNLEPFGKITLYHQTPRPAHVALFISGDGGWNLGVVDMARELEGMDALVAGVDIRHYMKASTADPDKCWDPGTDFAELGKAIEKKFGYSERVRPVLVGYSSGATIVYAAMGQAPPHTFRGGLSLGFCPDLIVNHPICKGRELSWVHDPHGKGVDFQPAPLTDPWLAFQGDIDQICTPADTRTYLSKVENGELVWLHKVGHGFSVPRNWMRQFKEGFAKVTGQSR